MRKAAVTARAASAADAEQPFKFLGYCLVLLVLFMPNMRRFTFTPLPGLNLLNIFFLVIVWAYYSARPHFTGPPRAAPISKYIFFFWFASFIALMNAMLLSEKPASIDEVVFFKNHIFYMGLYVVFFHAMRNRKMVDQVYWAIIVVTAVAGLQAVRQYMSIGATGYSTNARVSGPFGETWHNANMAGVFYAQFASVIFAELVFQRNKLLKLGLLGGFLITVMGLFYTYSRKSYYALAAATMLMGASASKALLIIILGVVGTFPVWAPDSAVERIMGNPEEKLQPPRVNKEGEEQSMDESTESRFILWEGAMKMWGDHPMGVGFERFKHYIGQYSPISNLDAHNYYVLVLAEMGPLGEFAFLLMVFMMYREGSKLAKVAKTPREKALAIGHRGAMLSMVIANTFGSAFNFGDMMGNMWVLTALVSRMRCIIEDEAAEARAAAKTVRRPMTA